MIRCWLVLVLLSLSAACGQYTPADKAPGATAETSQVPAPAIPSPPDQAVLAGGANQAANAPVQVRVAKETTYVLSPTDSAGNVDYFAALRERCSDGVTPESNAGLLFWQAVGPAYLPQNRRTEFFGSLGIQPPAASGDYFVSARLRAVRATKGGPPEKIHAFETRLRKELEALTMRPWSRSNSPEIAKWFEEDAAPLDKFIAASAKPRYFSPLLPAADDGLAGAMAPDTTLARDVGAVLTARGMLSVGEGRLADAGRDLLACHRLARLVAQGPQTMHLLVGVTMDRYACAGDAALARQPGLGAARAKRYVRVLQQAGPLAVAADKINLHDRLVVLDSACRLARGGPATMNRIARIAAEASGSPAAPDQLASIPDSAGHWGPGVSVDWNEVLMLLNARIDRMVAALRSSSPQDRDRAFADFGEEMRVASAALRHFGDAQHVAVLAGGSMPEGTTPTQFADWLSCKLLPSLPALCAIEETATTRWRLGQLALALGAYRTEHRAYPASLSELAPECIDQVPQDPCSGVQFRYKPERDSYVLYGVGPNRRDDDGRESADGTGSDDIVVRGVGGAQ